MTVAWSTPSLSQVPSVITLSPSLTWLESMSLTFLLPCSWLTHFVELSYWMVFSWLEPTLRTVSVEGSLLTLVTIPSQRAGFAAFASWEASCANTAVDSGKTSTDANNRVNSLFTMVTSSFFIAKIVRQETINRATHKEQAASKLGSRSWPRNPIPHARRMTARIHPLSSVASIQHRILTFFSDQLLEVLNDLIPSRHHRFNIIFVQIVLCLFRHFLCIQSLQLFQQLTVAAHQVRLGLFRFLLRSECP